MPTRLRGRLDALRLSQTRATMTTELASIPSARDGLAFDRIEDAATLLIVLPAYNEASRLDPIVREIRARWPDADVLVVDDGSADETSARARSAGAHVATHPFNLGYGAALETGYRYAMTNGYGLLAQMDADGQHDPASIGSLLEPLIAGRADVVVGSRFLSASEYRSSLARRAGSALFGALASLVTGRKITDPTSGLWAMNRRALAALAGGALPHDYPDADVLIGLHYAGLRVTEVPVVMRSSPVKISMHAGLRPLFYVYKMLLSMLLATLGRRPKVL